MARCNRSENWHHLGQVCALISLLLLASLAACMPSATTVSPPTATPAPTTTPTRTPTLPPTPTPSPAISSQVQLLEWELLGVPASYKPVESHWSLWDLQLWHERIYLAHGDWAGNTGPVRMIYYDLSSGEFVHDDGFIADEEAIEVYRVFDDTLYAPGADATEEWEFGNLYCKRWGETWVKRRAIPMALHMWDVGLLGETLVAIGRTVKGNNQAFGAVWTSTDNGQSWEWGPDFQAAGYAEPSSVFVLGGRLYVTTVGTGCIVFDGSTWAEADCLASYLLTGTAHVHKNALFENAVAMAPYWNILDTRLHFFDGAERWAVDFGQPVCDVVSTEEGLFVLSGVPSGQGAIYHASSLACRCAGDFARIVDLDMMDRAAPPERVQATLSLEYAGGRFYVGLADGRLFRSEPWRPAE